MRGRWKETARKVWVNKEGSETVVVPYPIILQMQLLLLRYTDGFSYFDL